MVLTGSTYFFRSVSIAQKDDPERKLSDSVVAALGSFPSLTSLEVGGLFLICHIQRCKC